MTGRSKVNIVARAEHEVSTTLASLALLKVNYDHRKSDYLDYFEPFFRAVLAESQGETVSRKKVQDDLREEFGLKIPLHPVELILQRLAKTNALKRVERTYLVGEIEIDDFTEARNEAQDALRRLCREIQKYVNGAHGAAWEIPEVETALLEYVSRYSMVFLKRHTTESVLPRVEADAEDLYFINDFIRAAAEEDDDWLDLFEILVKGNVLANGLLCPDLGSIQRKFSDVRFFVDTPLLIQLLELEGERRQAPVLELVKSLRKLDGYVAVFESTVEELQRVIASSRKNFDNPDYRSDIVDSFRERKLGPSDLLILEQNLEDELKNKNVNVRKDPTYAREYREWQIDEAALEARLSENIRYSTEKAVEHDVRAIRNIYTVRDGMRPRHVENAKAIFVTSNSALARQSMEFDADHESDADVGPVITDFSLSTLAFLKAPLEADNIPRLQMVSDCYAALSPSQEIWDKFEEQLNRLLEKDSISADEHQILRASPQTKNELMKMTRGSSDAFDDRTVEEVLSRVRESIESNVRQEAKSKLDSALAEADKERGKLEEDYNEQLSKKELAREREARRAERESDAAERARLEAETLRKRVVQIGDRVQQGVSMVVTFGLFLLVVPAALMSWDIVGGESTAATSWPLKMWLWIVIGIGGFVVPVYGLLTGQGLFHFGDKVGNRCRDWIVTLLLDADGD